MKFEVIPVIDIQGGLVVRAVMGRRDLYRPIETPLSSSPDPVAVATGLLKLHAFDKLYIGDIDAIERQGDNTAIVSRLQARFPHISIWTDNGSSTPDEVTRWLDRDLGTLVLGSESQLSGDTVRAFVDNPRIVLSLDFRGADFQGPPTLLDPSCWPRGIIVMTLARVGSVEGPDFERLTAIRARGGGANCLIYAAGGVRDGQDLVRLAGMGVTGALVASALHSGRLNEHHLVQLAGQ
jgi:phosphoribosylformimino-5-aminoimidazole carboxamide ribotide isomerase